MEQTNVDFEELFGIQFTPQEVPEEPELNRESIAILKKKTILTDELIRKFSETLTNFNILKKENIRNLQDLKKCRQTLLSHLKKNEPWEKKYHDLQSKFGLIEQEILFKDNLVAARDSSIRQYASLVKDQEVEISQLKAENKILKACDNSKSEEKWRKKYFNVLKRLRNLNSSNDKFPCSNCSTSKVVGQPLSEENNTPEFDHSTGIPPSVSSVDTGFESPNLSDCESERDLKTSKKKSKKQIYSTLNDTAIKLNKIEDVPRSTIEIPSEIIFVNDNIEVQVVVNKPGVDNSIVPGENVNDGCGGYNNCRSSVTSHDKYVQTFVHKYVDACINVKSDVLNKLTQTETIVQQKTSTVSRGTDPIDELVKVSEDSVVQKNPKRNCEIENYTNFSVGPSFEELSSFAPTVNYNRDINLASCDVLSSQSKNFEVGALELEDKLFELTSFGIPKLLSPLPVSPSVSPRATSPECRSKMEEEENMSDAEMNLNLTLDCDSSSSEGEEEEEVVVSMECNSTCVEAVAQTDFPSCSCQCEKRLVDFGVQVNLSVEPEVKSEFLISPKPGYNKYAKKQNHKQREVHQSILSDSKGDSFWKDLALFLMNRNSESSLSGCLQTILDEKPVLGVNSFLKEETSDLLPKKEDLEPLSDDCLTVKPVTVVMNCEGHHSNFNFQGNSRSRSQSVDSVEEVWNKEREKLSSKNKDKFLKQQYRKRSRSVRRNSLKRMKMVSSSDMQTSHSGTFIVSPIANRTSCVVERVLDNSQENERSAVTSCPEVVDITNNVQFESCCLNDFSKSKLKDKGCAFVEKMQTEVIRSSNTGSVPSGSSKTYDIDRTEKSEGKSFRNEITSESLPLSEIRIDHSSSIKPAGELDFIATKLPPLVKADTSSTNLDARVQSSIKSFPNIHSHSVQLNISVNETPLRNDVSECFGESSCVNEERNETSPELPHDENGSTDLSEECCSIGEVDSDDTTCVENRNLSPDTSTIYSQETVHLDLSIPSKGAMNNNSSFCTATSQSKSTSDPKPSDCLSTEVCKSSDNSYKEPYGFSLVNGETVVMSEEANILVSNKCSEMSGAKENLPRDLSTLSDQKHSGLESINRNSKNFNTILHHGNFSRSVFSSESDSDEETISLNTNEGAENHQELTELPSAKNVKGCEVFSKLQSSSNERIQTQNVVKKQSTGKGIEDLYVSPKLSLVSKINVGVENEGKQSQIGILQEFTSKEPLTSVSCSQESYSTIPIVNNVSSGYSSEVSTHDFSSFSSVSLNTVFSASFSVNETNLQKDSVGTQNPHSEPKIIRNQDERITNSKGNDSGFLELTSPSVTTNTDVSNAVNTINMTDQKEISITNDSSFSKVSFRQLCKRSISEKIPVVAPSERDAMALKRKIMEQARVLSSTPQKMAKREEELICKNSSLKGNTHVQQRQLAPELGEGNVASNPFCRLGMSGRRKPVCGIQSVHTTLASHEECSTDDSAKTPNYLEISRKQGRVAHIPRHRSCDDPKVPTTQHTALEDHFPKRNNGAHVITRRLTDSANDNASCSELGPMAMEKENVILDCSEKHKLKGDSSILSQNTFGRNMQRELSCETSTLIMMETVNSVGTSNKSETSDIPGFSKCSEYIPNQKNHFSSFTFRDYTPKQKSQNLSRSTKTAGRGKRGRRATGKKTVLQKLKDQCVKLRKNSQIGQEISEELGAHHTIVNESNVKSNVCKGAEQTKPLEEVSVEEDSALCNDDENSSDGKKSSLVWDKSEITCSKSTVLLPDTKSEKLFSESISGSIRTLSEDLTLSDSDESVNEISDSPKKTKSSNSELLALEKFGATNISVSSSNVKSVIQKESSESSLSSRMEYSVQSSIETTNVKNGNLNVDLSIDSFVNVSNTQEQDFLSSFGQEIDLEVSQMININSHQILMSKDCLSLDSHNKVKETNYIKVNDSVNVENKGNSPCKFVKELNVNNKIVVEAFDGSENQPDVLWEDNNNLKIDSPASPPDLQDRSSNSYSCVTIPCSPVRQTNVIETPCSPEVVGGNNCYKAVKIYDTGVSSSNSDEGDREERENDGVSESENDESDNEDDEDNEDVCESPENNGRNNVYFTRSKLRSWNRNKSHSRTKLEHSLLAKYINNHYHGKEKKPKLSREAQRKKEIIEEKLQSELDVYVESEFSQASYTNILQFCERLPKNHLQILVKCVVKCVKYTSRDPYDYSNPNASPLTEVQKRLLTLVVNLEVHHPTIVDDVLKRIHYIVCDYSHHHYDATLFSLARFFLAFCKLRNNKQYVQVFFYDALYCLKLRGYGVLSAIITGYADVFPKAGHCAKDSILIKVIVFIIFNYGRITYLKTSSIRSYFSVYYGYKRDDLPNLDALLKLFLEEIKRGTNPEVEQAVLLLSKFQSNWHWTYNKLIKGGLLRVIDSWKLGNASEDAAILSIKLIAFLARTAPYEKEDSSLLMNDFEKLISSNTCTSRVKEACIIGLASFIQVDELKGITILKNCKVDDYLENSESVKESLNSVCQRRTNKYWKQFISEPKVVPLKVTKTYLRKKKN